MGERTTTGNGGILRHAELGTGMRGGGWRMAGVDDIQVGGTLHRERRQEAGDKREGFDDEWLRMGRQ